MDKNKCPKSKTQFTFRIFFVIESFANISIFFLLPIIIMIFYVSIYTINLHNKYTILKQFKKKLIY